MLRDKYLRTLFSKGLEVWEGYSLREETGKQSLTETVSHTTLLIYVWGLRLQVAGMNFLGENPILILTVFL